MSIGQKITDIIEILNVELIEKFVEKDIVQVIKLLDNAGNFPNKIRKILSHLICQNPEKYFSDPSFRSLFYKSMTKEKILEATKRLKLNNCNDFLNLDPSKDREIFSEYLGFFGISKYASNNSTPNLEIEQVKVNFGLFPHQIQAVKKIWNVIGDGHGRVVLHMPTGAGKTRTAMHFLCRYLNVNEGVVVWLANSNELLVQAVDAFAVNAWPNLGARDVDLCRMWGIYNPDIDNIKDGFLVAGLQKMHSCSKREPNKFQRLASRVKLVIVDEAHQSIAPTYKEIIEKIADSGEKNALLGLTATPGRTWSDVAIDQGLSEFFNEKKVILQIPGSNNPVEYLIKEGYLARPIFRKLPHLPTGQLKTKESLSVNSTNDYSNEILDELAQDAARNKIIIDELNQLISDGHKRIIFFGSSVRHAEILAAILSVLEVDAQLVTGETPKEDRQRAIKKFIGKTEKPMVMCNYGVLTTGFDAPKTSAAIIARPTRSLVLFSQMVGRATRGVKAGGNKSCTISTIVDTTLPGFGDMAEAFMNWEDVWGDEGR